MEGRDEAMGPRMPSGSQQARAALSVLYVDADLRAAERLVRGLAEVSALAVVPSVTAAYNAIAARVPSLIVTEIDLPDGSGLDLITRVHATPGLRQVLLMVVTARTAVQDKIAAFQAGADDYLVKPLDPSLFAMHVRLLSKFRRVVES